MKAKIIIDELGGTSKVANIFGISSQAVSQWKQIPAKHVFKICESLNHKYKPEDIRPDFFHSDTP